jgi:phage shock protein PspC (stress-responsive transcriptional regulator)
MLAGVCAGIAERYNVSVSAVRLAFVVGTFLPVVPGPLVYAALWLLLPEEEQTDQ